eukprot:TRINITY_DN24942_c0_g1_i1.p1 TRINITY_DN24942_c0_g1~~TRINITY_DN24942_c0_g1_i1.p1  ORF type:complete len:155 (+),score=30.25 TRINITY_DN24942_c0_g1_i1:74-538(+)
MRTLCSTVILFVWCASGARLPKQGIPGLPILETPDAYNKGEVSTKKGKTDRIEPSPSPVDTMDMLDDAWAYRLTSGEPTTLACPEENDHVPCLFWVEADSSVASQGFTQWPCKAQTSWYYRKLKSGEDAEVTPQRDTTIYEKSNGAVPTCEEEL